MTDTKRNNWAEAAKLMRQNNDDELLIPAVFEDEEFDDDFLQDIKMTTKDIKVGDKFLCYHNDNYNIYSSYIVEIKKILDFNDAPHYVTYAIQNYLSDEHIDNSFLIDAEVIGIPIGEFDINKYSECAHYNTFVKQDEEIINVFPNPIFDGYLDIDGEKTANAIQYFMFETIDTNDMGRLAEVAKTIYPNINEILKKYEYDD